MVRSSVLCRIAAWAVRGGTPPLLRCVPNLPRDISLYLGSFRQPAILVPWFFVNLALDAAESGYTMRQELQELEFQSVPGGLRAQLIGDLRASGTMDQATLSL